MIYIFACAGGWRMNHSRDFALKEEQGDIDVVGNYETPSQGKVRI